MNDEMRNKVTAQIRKLLCLGNDAGAHDGEITAAMAAAERLMLKYQISRAEAEQAGVERPTQYTTGDVHATTWRVMQWEIYLGSAIIELLGTVHWLKYTTVEREVGTFKTSKRVLQLRFYGPDDDVAMAVDLWNEWHHVIATLAMGKYNSLYAGKGAAYALGFAQQLFIRARQASSERKRITVQSSSTTALVLIENAIQKKRSEAAAWYEREHGKLGKARSGRRYRMREEGGDAYRQGASDGQRAQFEAKRHKRLGA